MIGHSNFNLSDKELIVRRIAADIQDKKCYIELFKLLFEKNISYEKQKWNIFYVSILSDDVLNIIDNILTYHEIKKSIL